MNADYATSKAKELLRHYFRLAIEETNQRCDSDMYAEIDDIVDCIIAAAGTPAPEPDQPPQPDPLTRIAIALEQIEQHLNFIASTKA